MKAIRVENWKSSKHRQEDTTDSLEKQKAFYYWYSKHRDFIRGLLAVLCCVKCKHFQSFQEPQGSALELLGGFCALKLLAVKVKDLVLACGAFGTKYLESLPNYTQSRWKILLPQRQWLKRTLPLKTIFHITLIYCFRWSISTGSTLWPGCTLCPGYTLWRTICKLSVNNLVPLMINSTAKIKNHHHTLVGESGKIGILSRNLRINFEDSVCYCL